VPFATVYLFAHWVSVLAGVFGLAWLFFAGIIAMICQRSGMLRQAQTPAFIALTLLVASGMLPLRLWI